MANNLNSFYRGNNRKGWPENGRKIRPDLILLDIQLPDIDGYEVARKLRDQSCMLSIPIVAVTSYAMVGDSEKAFDAGCDGYIEKPVNPNTFIDEINKILSKDISQEG